MLDRPSGKSLLGAVIELMRGELMPSLDAALAFKVRVAANALELVIREMEAGQAAQAAEHQGLIVLLGQEGRLHELNNVLCEAIRDRRITLATPGLSEHLWNSTLDKLAIEQPRYVTYSRVLAERKAGESS